jgi:hypothetical protein
MFAKFVCAIALVASTGAMAETVTLEEFEQRAFQPAGQKETYVDEIAPGGWNPRANSRYQSWVGGIIALRDENCNSHVHYKVDAAMCEQMGILVKYVNEMALAALRNGNLVLGGK